MFRRAEISDTPGPDSGRGVTAAGNFVVDPSRPNLTGDLDAMFTSAPGAAEAEEILADARTEADARLRKAAEIKQLAVEASDRMRQEARLVRAEAAAAVER